MTPPQDRHGAPAAWLRTLPKVELHVHLEGSVHAETAVRLAERHGEDPEEVLVLADGDYPRRYRDFDHFVATFNATARQLRDPADLRTAARDFARHQADQHVLYTEATFTALTHVRNGMDPAAMWAAVAEGVADVADTRVRLIVDVVREEGPEHAARTIELVRRAPDGLVAGLGLAGVEGSVPERAFRELRTAADDLGLGLAVHAGEAGGPENVRAALDELAADRIGHGIAATRDDDVLAALAASGVPAEVCPSSNVSLGVVETLADHPLPAMVAAGVAVVIGSDDPPFFGTTLTDELGHAARLLDLDRSGVLELQRRAARAAFLPADERAALVAAIDAGEPDRDT